MNDPTAPDLFPRLAELNEIGIALSREKDIDRLLEAILRGGQERSPMPTAERCTASTTTRNCASTIMRTDSLGIAMGGTTGRDIPYAPVQLYDEDGRPNNSMVVAYSVLHDQTVNIADAYTAQGFDFSGTKSFDRKTGYRSQSFLTVPMKDHEDEIIGVLQLINAKDRVTGAIVPFLRGRPAAGRIACFPGGGGADQPPADRPAASSCSKSLHRADQRRHRRQVALYRRPLPARARAHDDARRGGQQHQGRAAQRVRHDGEGPLRAEDRRPAARLRQGHHARARGGQGHQAADHLRPHRR